MTATVIGARKDDDADFRVVARFGKRVVHFVDGKRRERIAALGSIDGDLRDAIERLVDDFAVFLTALPLEVAHILPSYSMPRASLSTRANSLGRSI